MPTRKRKKSSKSSFKTKTLPKLISYQKLLTRLSVTYFRQIRTRVQSLQLKPIHWLTIMNIGIVLCMLSIFFYFYSQTILSFKVSPVVTAPSELRNAYPTKIGIKSLNLNLAITPAGIKDGIWQTSEKTATYLATSARPAEGGNVVIYGHNKNHLFAPLHSLKIGDVISLTTADGTAYEYKVDEIKTVDPANVEEVMPTQTEILTVYTCTGFFDSKRLVVKASPFKVSAL